MRLLVFAKMPQSLRARPGHAWSAASRERWRFSPLPQRLRGGHGQKIAIGPQRLCSGRGGLTLRAVGRGLTPPSGAAHAPPLGCPVPCRVG